MAAGFYIICLNGRIGIMVRPLSGSFINGSLYFQDMTKKEVMLCSLILLCVFMREWRRRLGETQRSAQTHLVAVLSFVSREETMAKVKDALGRLRVWMSNPNWSSTSLTLRHLVSGLVFFLAMLVVIFTFAPLIPSNITVRSHGQPAQ